MARNPLEIGAVPKLTFSDNVNAPNLAISYEIYDCNGNLMTKCLTDQWQECILDGFSQATILPGGNTCSSSYSVDPFFCQSTPVSACPLANLTNVYNVKVGSYVKNMVESLLGTLLTPDLPLGTPVEKGN